VSGAGWALLALLGAIVLSLTSRVNVGIVALALAWLAGTAGAGLTAEAVLGGFPGSLFVTLLGVTLLFAAAEANGTLAALAAARGRLARGDARVLPGSSSRGRRCSRRSAPARCRRSRWWHRWRWPRGCAPACRPS
jgi:hypothetical protein